MHSGNFQMYTPEGNRLVAVIVKQVNDSFTSLADKWLNAQSELHQLALLSGFSEANDTAVREEVYCVLRKEAAHEAIMDALQCLVLCHKTRQWLEENDPMALSQALAALEMADEDS